MGIIESTENQKVRTAAPKRLLALFLATTLVFTMLPISGIFGGTNVAEAATPHIKSTFVDVNYMDGIDTLGFSGIYPKPAAWPKNDYGYDVHYYISKLESYRNNKLVRTLNFAYPEGARYRFNYKERNKSTRFVVTFTKFRPTDPGPATFTDSVTVKIAKGGVMITKKTQGMKAGKKHTRKFSVKGEVFKWNKTLKNVKVTKGIVTLKVGKKIYKGKLKKGVATFKNVYYKRSTTCVFKLKNSNYWENTTRKFLLY
jgi:hypothetical protein